MTLIKDVNKNGVTPETVKTSCNAASQVYKLLRLNFEIKNQDIKWRKYHKVFWSNL